MSWADSLQQRLEEWGKAAFAHEVEIDFSRAQVFDGKWVRHSFDALRQFSKEDLQILGNILPVSNPELRNSFPDRERQLLAAFEETFRQQVLSRREQMIKEAIPTALGPLKKESVEIRRRAPAVFKRIAKRLECEIRKAETSVWMLSRLWNALGRNPHAF